MQSRALVAVGHVRQAMGGLERELLEDLRDRDTERHRWLVTSSIERMGDVDAIRGSRGTCGSAG